MIVQVVIIDSESTGLESLVRKSSYDNTSATTDEVVQFSAIVTDINLGIKQIVNRYCFTNVNIDPVIAAKTHKLDAKELYALSGGKYLEDVFEEIDHIWRDKPTIFVGYNISHDIRLINATLGNQGLPKMRFGDPIGALKKNLRPGVYYMDAMKLLCNVINGGNIISQEQLLLRKTGYDRESFKKLFLLLMSKFPEVHVRTADFHDALPDTVALWTLLQKYKGMIYA